VNLLLRLMRRVWTRPFSWSKCGLRRCWCSTIVVALPCPAAKRSLIPLRLPRWRWRRIGAYTRIGGTIGQREPKHRLFRLTERPHIWFSVGPDVPIPPVGMVVMVLAEHMFWEQFSTALLLSACLVQPAAASGTAAVTITADGA
jgi:hypothetical protein